MAKVYKMAKRLTTLFFLVLCLLGATVSQAQTTGGDMLTIKGEVVESIAHQPLRGAKVALLDSLYNELDTLTANPYGTVITNGDRSYSPALFFFTIPRKGAKYYLSVELENYKPLVRLLDLTHLGKREKTRDLGMFVIERAPRQLGEVTVKATKIKFYNKGDTLVFDAEAFILPEGSMLDALVAQLPGVELRDNGQIFVNGRFVENLILNGQDFFKGNSRIMLDNLSSYMVKDVAVYEKASRESEFAGRDLGDKTYVMDVRLKKEYRQGWIVNMEGGGGTSSRYLARLFGMRYTDFSRLGLFANINNLNDIQNPGQSNSFDPLKMQKGDRVYQEAGLTYSTKSRSSKWSLLANGILAHSKNFRHITTTTTNSLPVNDTYAYRFNDGIDRNWRMYANARVSMREKLFMSTLTPEVTYTSYDNTSNSVEATFNEEQQYVSRVLLDSLYTQGSSLEVGEIVNKVSTRALGRGHDLNTSFLLNNIIKIPGSQDLVSLIVDGNYQESRKRTFDFYRINTGTGTRPSTDKGLWSDTRPSRSHTVHAVLKYDWIITPYYEFTHRREEKNRVTHMMEHLADMEIYGITPPEGAVFSTDDSYWSVQWGNSHLVGISYGKTNTTSRGNVLRIVSNVALDARRDHIAYTRFDSPYRVSRPTVLPRIYGGVSYQWKPVASPHGPIHMNTAKLSYRLSGTTPRLDWLVPIVDTTDPMNIYVGVDRLDNELNHVINASWKFMAYGGDLSHTLDLEYTLTDNRLVRGYNYNSQTGVRTFCPYNVGGTWNESGSSLIALMFGYQKRLSLSHKASLSYGHVTDMIGRDIGEPVLTTIRNMFFTDNIRLDWKISGNSLGIKADIILRHTTSDQTAMRVINSTTANVGFTGTFRLPAGIGLSTDLTLYTRSGYNDPGLDKHDVVWNVRMSRSFAKNRFTILVDGFDLLHQLSNVTYDISPSARIVTYTNSLPRYVLFHAIYRLDIKPPKLR